MLSINWTFLVQLGFFLTFTVIVNLLLFRPMRQYLARRQRTIDNLRASAGEHDATLARLSEKYTQKIANAKDEIHGLRSVARKETIELQKSMLEEAKRASIAEIDAAEDELLQEVTAARENLAGESRALAAAIAGKVLGRAR